MGMVGEYGDQVFLSLGLNTIIFGHNHHTFFDLSGTGTQQVFLPFNLNQTEAAAFARFLGHSVVNPSLALVDHPSSLAPLGHRQVWMITKSGDVYPRSFCSLKNRDPSQGLNFVIVDNKLDSVH
jgi:hypothetical protein